MPLGGGGYNTQLVVDSSGAMFTGIDVFGGYVGSTVAGTLWTQEATETAVPSAYQGTPYLYGGTRGAAIDPLNNQIMIWMYAPLLGSNSTLWYTANGGLTWIQSGNFPFTSDQSNTSDGGRLAGQRMAIDPYNDNHALVGTMSGLYETTNLKSGASATWNLISTSSVPAPTNDFGISGVQFDANGGTTGGIATRVVVGVNGHGVYATANGEASWSAISSAPTAIEHGYMASDENYYAVSTSGTVYLINSSNTFVHSWTTSNGFQCLAINPANPAQGVGFNPEGNVATQSAAINGGSAPTSTTNFTTATYSVTDAPWIGVAGAFNSDSDCAWDPLNTTSTTSLTIGSGSKTLTVGTGQNIVVGDVLRISQTGTLTNYMMGSVTAYTSGTGSLTVTVGSVSSGGYLGGTTGGSGTAATWTVTKERVWVAFGVGVAYMDTFPSSGAPKWTSQTAGIESLVAGGGEWPTSGNPTVTSDDRTLWPIPANPLASTNGLPGYGPDYSSVLREGNFANFDPSTPANWIAANNECLTGCGSPSAAANLSTTGGGVGTAANGNVTSYSKYTNQPSVHGPVVLSNGCAMVAPMGSGTIQANNGGGLSGTWSATTGGPSSVVSTSTFAFWANIHPFAADYVNAGTIYVFANNNIYKDTNCSSWTSVYSSFSTNNFLVQLKSVPGKAGDLFFTAGSSNGTTTTSITTIKSSHPNSQQFYYCHDSGSNPITCTGLSNVKEVLTFAVGAANGGSYPTIYIAGWVNVSGTYTYSWYQCTNFNPASLGSETWTSIGAFPKNIDLPQMAIADPNNAGYLVSGFQGSGYAFYGNSSTWP
jgi:hypothetical protein